MDTINAIEQPDIIVTALDCPLVTESDNENPLLIDESDRGGDPPGDLEMELNEDRDHEPGHMVGIRANREVPSIETPHTEAHSVDVDNTSHTSSTTTARPRRYKKRAGGYKWPGEKKRNKPTVKTTTAKSLVKTGKSKGPISTVTTTTIFVSERSAPSTSSSIVESGVMRSVAESTRAFSKNEASVQPSIPTKRMVLDMLTRQVRSKATASPLHALRKNRITTIIDNECDSDEELSSAQIETTNDFQQQNNLWLGKPYKHCGVIQPTPKLVLKGKKFRELLSSIPWNPVTALNEISRCPEDCPVLPPPYHEIEEYTPFEMADLLKLQFQHGDDPIRLSIMNNTFPYKLEDRHYSGISMNDRLSVYSEVAAMCNYVYNGVWKVLEGLRLDKLEIRRCITLVDKTSFTMDKWNRENLYSEYLINALPKVNFGVIRKKRIPRIEAIGDNAIYQIVGATVSNQQIDYYLVQFLPLNDSLGLKSEQFGRIKWFEATADLFKNSRALQRFQNYGYSDRARVSCDGNDTAFGAKQSPGKRVLVKPYQHDMSKVLPINMAPRHLCRDSLDRLLGQLDSKIFKSETKSFERTLDIYSLYERFVEISQEMLTNTEYLLCAKIVGKPLEKKSEIKSYKFGVPTFGTRQTPVMTTSSFRKYYENEFKSFGATKRFMIVMLFSFNGVDGLLKQNKHSSVLLLERVGGSYQYWFWDPSVERQIYFPVCQTMLNIIGEMRSIANRNGPLRRAFDNQQNGQTDCAYRCFKFMALIIDGYNFRKMDFRLDSDLKEAKEDNIRANCLSKIYNL